MKNDLTSHTFDTLETIFDHYFLIGISKSDEDGNSELCSVHKGDPEVVRGLKEAGLEMK
jgi:hypothetical protein